MDSDKTCAHDVPWRSIHVWNDNCPKCRAGAELTEAARNRAHFVAGKGIDDDGKPSGMGNRRTFTPERVTINWRDGVVEAAQ